MARVVSCEGGMRSMDRGWSWDGWGSRERGSFAAEGGIVWGGEIAGCVEFCWHGHVDGWIRCCMCEVLCMYIATRCRAGSGSAYG